MTAAPYNLRHGETAGLCTPEYRCWRAIRNRCRSPSSKDYKKYGAKGIFVAPEWDSYERFLSDMGRKPGPEYSIDRIDGAGPYAPGNCRWATTLEQNRNRRTTRRFSFEGQALTLVEWSEKTGIPYIVLVGRHKRGWSASAALTVPPLGRGGRLPTPSISFGEPVKGGMLSLTLTATPHLPSEE
jgi:hypothetical protein